MVNTWPTAVMRSVLSSETTMFEPSMAASASGFESTLKMSSGAASIVLEALTFISR